MKDQNEKRAIEEMANFLWKNTIIHTEDLCHDVAETCYIEGYRKQSEWISVEERLPEDVYGKDRKKISVLVCTESGRVSTASRQRLVKFNSTKLEWVELDTFGWSMYKRVTHWMPLPEPPKMKGGE